MSNPIEELIIAANEGNLSAVKSFLAKGADVNAGFPGNGATALMAAAQDGRIEIVHFLLKNGANVNTTAANGGTALTAAASSGQKHAVEVLLRAGADVNATRSGDGCNALTLASSSGHLDIVRLLLDAKANIHAQMANGRTALDEALRLNRAEIASLLKQRGASTGPSGTKLGDELLPAAEKGDLGKIKSLLAQGADVNARNNKGSTALMQACIGGNVETVRALLAAGADVNAKDWTDETTALLLACMKDHVSVAKVLLEAGAHVLVKAKDRDWTPLYVAASLGNSELVSLLLDAGAGDNVEFKTNAVAVAICQGHKEIGRLILDPERQGKPFYQVLEDAVGRVIGIWVADPSHPNFQARIEMLIAGEKDKGMSLEHFIAFKEGRYKTIPNKTDGRGGAFLMFEGAALAESKVGLAKKKWWKFW